MASITTRKSGSRFIEFVLKDNRRTVSIGQCSRRTAQTIKGWIERLVEAAYSGSSPDAETCRWVGEIDDKLAAKLAKVELIAPRQKQVSATLDAFIADYLASRSDVKANTRFNLEVARRNLVTYFGADKPLSAITAGDADEFRLWLRGSQPNKPGEPMPPGFADNTARRTCGRAKQFFESARKKKLIAECPFAEIGDCQVRANKTRDRFVIKEEAQKVLDACPNTQWRLVFALSRFGGLRCPSEHAGLRWADIDWPNNRFNVHSPKTEHHEGKESRIVPIFPELRPHLDAAWAELPKDAEYVLTLTGMARNRQNGKSANLGTTMAKIIKTAGLTPWPKLFHNLRASRQTELAQTFPEHVVCAWLGNSPKVAREHYLRVTETDHAKATGQPFAKSAGPGAGQDAQGAAQGQAPAVSGEVRQIIEKALSDKGLAAEWSVISQLLENYQAPQVGHSANHSLVERGTFRVKRLGRQHIVELYPWTSQDLVLSAAAKTSAVNRDRLALARFYQSLLNSGVVDSRADLARYVGVSRARVTQVLKRLASDCPSNNKRRTNQK